MNNNLPRAAPTASPQPNQHDAADFRHRTTLRKCAFFYEVISEADYQPLMLHSVWTDRGLYYPPDPQRVAQLRNCARRARVLRRAEDTNEPTK